MYIQETIEIGETITNQRAKFKPQSFHAKYVDDLTIAESFNLKEVLISNPDRVLPENYHARFGQKLSGEKSNVYSQISKLDQYALQNEMKINCDKYLNSCYLIQPKHLTSFLIVKSMLSKLRLVKK